MSVDTSALEFEIVDDLRTELQSEPTFSEDILAIKVKLAVRELIAKRNYKATSYSEEQIVDDLYNYYTTICNVARYDYNMVGAEGEISHTENGVSRTYANRDSLFLGVHAFVNVL